MDRQSGGGVDAFTELGPTVRAVLSERGFQTPTEPQQRAIPVLATGAHALIIAPTGTGKTETAMLPVFDALVDAGDREGIGALYITPLRALNRDMRDRLDWWGDELDLDIDVRHGDTTRYRRTQQANDPPDVLVTTPETVQAMLTGSKLRRALSTVDHVVVDEVHELADSKRGAQLSIALERLRDLAGQSQRIGLSATVGDPDTVGAFLTGNRPVSIVEINAGSDLSLTVTTPEITSEDERLAGQLMTEADVASHVRAMDEIVAANESTLIFVNTRQTAEALGSRFKAIDANIGVHHGSLSKRARIDVENRFKAGELDALLCTSSMELGIDVGRIDHVIQYSSPREVSRLLQRVGRAGHHRDERSHGTIITTRPDDTFEALVIAERAKRGAVEPTPIHEGSLDTVANQITGLLMGHGEISARRAYEIITRAYPFASLDESTFREIVRELSNNRLIWLEESADRLEKSGGTWQYFYENLSMIPDEETFAVDDVASGRQIGTLDEKFVVNFAEPGEVFIQQGEMWRIVEVDEEDGSVTVSPIEDPGGEVPSWTGKEIPVPYAVAQDVGSLRRALRDQFDAGESMEAVAAWLCERYLTDDHTAGQALKQLERHTQALPDANTLVIESRGREMVLNACFGHTVNETLGRVLSALIGQQTGSSVGMDTDPYRIEFELPRGVSRDTVVELLETTEPAHVAGIIELALKNSDVLKFMLAQVAGKFGALKRWRGSGSIGRTRLLDALSETPVYDEAVRAVLYEELDVERTADVLERIQSGALGVETVSGRTPIGTGGRSSKRELLTPENADASVIQTVKERIQEDRILLFCLHCQEFERKQSVKRVREQPQCPLCESTQIAALNPWADDVIDAVTANEKDDEQEKMTKRAYQSASLVQAHGKQAVIALAARGVGPHNAARIIAKLRENEDDFYRDILAQEQQYARTKAFW